MHTSERRGGEGREAKDTEDPSLWPSLGRGLPHPSLTTGAEGRVGEGSRPGRGDLTLQLTRRAGLSVLLVFLLVSWPWIAACTP